MANVRTPRESWIDQGLRLLADGGLAAVRVEPLAEALGVSKGGFYWHFPDRQALLDAMLDAWQRLCIDDVIARIDAEGGDARTRLQHLFGIPGSEHALQVDLAIRDWARRDPVVAERLRDADNRRMAYMRALFADFSADADDAEIRSLVAFSLWIGSHFIAADHEGRTRAQMVGRALKRLLEPAPG